MRLALDSGEDPLDLIREGAYAMIDSIEAGLKLRNADEKTRSGAWLEWLTTLNAFEE
jgi:hypothetical protein